MSHKLINLLPEDRIRAFRRDYFLHLAVAGILLLTLITVIHGILLFPSYLSLAQKRDAKAMELAKLNAGLEGSKQEEVSARLAALKGDATYLARLDKTPSASAAVRAVLAAPRAGIKITSISITPSVTGAADGKMAVSGIAATREALRAYDLALAGLPFVSNADLPINAYAEESNIGFSITLTGTLTP